MKFDLSKEPKFVQEMVKTMSKKKRIDIIDLKQEIQTGLLEVYIKKNNIFLKDTENEECVCIGNVVDAIENGNRRDYRGRV